MRRWSVACWLPILLASVLSESASADGNRLTHLDRPTDPYVVGQSFAALTTPQWVGAEGVMAVVTLGIDDLNLNEATYEAMIRPILDRLALIDGRAPVSIFTNRTTNNAMTQGWLAEGLSIESHSVTHTCPLLQGGNFAAAADSIHDNVDALNSIPNILPVAFRTPCMDSQNSHGPRLLAEILEGASSGGNFLWASSSIAQVFTEVDSSLPAALVFDGASPRFSRYLPWHYANRVDNYPYPWVVGRKIWETGFTAPSDFNGQARNGVNASQTVEDWTAAIDLTVLEQGLFSLVFHPHGWIQSSQVVELVDHVVTTHGSAVQFMNFEEVVDALEMNALGGQSLRDASGADNGVRLLDLDDDGLMDVLVGNAGVQQTRRWDATSGAWVVGTLPVQIIDGSGDAGVRFGVMQSNGNASLFVRNNSDAGRWDFDGGQWVAVVGGLNGFDLGGPIQTSVAGLDQGVRFRDLDGDGITEVIVGNPTQQGVFQWSESSATWTPLPYSLPPGLSIVDAAGGDAGIRFVDLNGDGFDDIVSSNASGFSVHLWESMFTGWALSGASGPAGGPVPEIVRADGSNNGAWFRAGAMWVQNENTGSLANQVRRIPDHTLAGVTINQVQIFDAVTQVDNTRVDAANAIDGNFGTSSYLTPAATNTPHIAAFGLSSPARIRGVRVAKAGDIDALGGIDRMDLQILVTTDLDPLLADRNYVPVTGLHEALGEGITAATVIAATGSVDDDSHDFATEGFYVLLFDSVEASAVAVRFEREATDPLPWTHYPVVEMELVVPEPGFWAQLAAGLGLLLMLVGPGEGRRRGAVGTDLRKIPAIRINGVQFAFPFESRVHHRTDTHHPQPPRSKLPAIRHWRE